MNVKRNSTQKDIVDEGKLNANYPKISRFTHRGNSAACCRWRKNYRNHGLIEDICGWNIIQTRIVVSTANPVTEICDGQAYARYYLCLHLFPATDFCNHGYGSFFVTYNMVHCSLLTYWFKTHSYTWDDISIC